MTELHPDATMMTDGDLRLFATALLKDHDPLTQQDQSTGFPNRCNLCNYTRHPCDTFDLAAHTLVLLDRLEKA